VPSPSSSPGVPRTFFGYALHEAVETMTALWCRPMSKPVLTVVLTVATGVVAFMKVGGL
jgi:hypothetical protein